MLLKRETEVEGFNTFLDSIQFKNSNVTLPIDILNHNVIVKGNRNSGKTEKVLIPSVRRVKEGALYIDFYGEAQEEVKKMAKENIYGEKKFFIYNKRIPEIISLLDNGYIVYFTIEEKKDLIELNKLITLLENIAFKKQINMLIDNINYLGEIKSLPNLIINNDTINVIMTLCYSSQLEEFYSKDIVKKIKEETISYDVNKQI